VFARGFKLEVRAKSRLKVEDIGADLCVCPWFQMKVGSFKLGQRAKSRLKVEG
jgi:hypothetical protein